ncbi:Predicted thioesterase [Fulvimarina pelagi HTCC2506]|uniref:Predicted thioesterase n=1 Tax=Fulvimarina pelagi HTCC2506 TaxID=314231 RepID=Q0G225_9HYPH|nr:thioesterase family protein [Fulvimarina pelagi]EAU41373.1 Predicted thioesterase [Fulvimarina pelagi HTCC2506]
MADLPQREDYPHITEDKLRFADMDRQGHVNNVAFMQFLEQARCEVVYDPDDPLAPEGCAFVVAHIAIDFLDEMIWPGTVETATRVQSVGRSSIKIEQALFQNGKPCAKAFSVVVLTNETNRRSTPLPDEAVARMRALEMSR